ncbi:hypothetical protein YC2023_085555 [Brassica napus]
MSTVCPLSDIGSLQVPCSLSADLMLLGATRTSRLAGRGFVVLIYILLADLKEGWPEMGSSSVLDRKI